MSTPALDRLQLGRRLVEYEAAFQVMVLEGIMADQAGRPPFPGYEDQWKAKRHALYVALGLDVKETTRE